MNHDSPSTREKNACIEETTVQSIRTGNEYFRRYAWGLNTEKCPDPVPRGFLRVEHGAGYSDQLVAAAISLVASAPSEPAETSDSLSDTGSIRLGHIRVGWRIEYDREIGGLVNEPSFDPHSVLRTLVVSFPKLN